MGIVTDSWEPALRKSANKQFFITYLALVFLYNLIVLVFILLLIAFVFMLVGPIPTDPSQMVTFFLGLVTSPSFIGGLVLSLVLLMVFLVVLTVFYSGMALNIAALFFMREDKSVGAILGEAYSRTKPRVWDIIKTSLLVDLITFIPLLLLGAIVLIPAVLSAGASSNPTAIIGAAFFLIGLIFVWLFFILALTPMLMLTTLVPLFEKRGAFSSLRRMWELGKANYWTNFGFFGILCVTLIGASIAFGILVIPIEVPLQVAIDSQDVGAILTVIIPLFILRFVLQLLFDSWAMGFSSLVSIRMFEVDTGKHLKKEPVKKEEGPSKVRPAITDLPKRDNQQIGYFERTPDFLRSEQN